jgi:hypothetical protein
MNTSLALLLLLAPFMGFYLMFSLEKHRKISFWIIGTYCCTFVLQFCLFFLK